MPDNTAFTPSTDPASPKIADDEVSYSGDLAKVQLIQLVIVNGLEGSRTVSKLASGAGVLADALRVVLASDQPALPITESRVAAITTSSQVSVTTAAATLLAANAARRTAIFRNLGPFPIYLGKATVTAANGQLLNSGDTLVDDLTTALWQAIAVGGTSTVAITEV